MLNTTQSTIGPKCIARYIFALLIFVTSCTGKDIQVFKEMIPLHNALVKRYKVEDIRVTVWNGTCLSISFINSPFNKLPDKEKESKATEIARYVNSHYASIKNIQSILIGFVVYKNYVLFDYTNSLHSYFFNTANL